ESSRRRGVELRYRVLALDVVRRRWCSVGRAGTGRRPIGPTNRMDRAEVLRPPFCAVYVRRTGDERLAAALFLVGLRKLPTGCRLRRHQLEARHPYARRCRPICGRRGARAGRGWPLESPVHRLACGTLLVVYLPGTVSCVGGPQRDRGARRAVVFEPQHNGQPRLSVDLHSARRMVPWGAALTRPGYLLCRTRERAIYVRVYAAQSRRG